MPRAQVPGVPACWVHARTIALVNAEIARILSNWPAMKETSK